MASVVDSYASNGTLNARYVTPGLDANLSMTRSGNTYYYMADGLGSVRNVVESDEDVANTYDYYAFGNTLGSPTVGVTNPFEYTGREFENGSVNTTFFYRNRYYMSALGIFTSRDAYEEDVHCGWGYVANSPIMETDPEGLSLLSDAWDFAKGMFTPLPAGDGCSHDWLDCMNKCMDINDPMNEYLGNLGSFLGKMGLTGVGGTFPYKWVPKFARGGMRAKLVGPTTTVPSWVSQLLGMGPGNFLRNAGRFFNPAFIGYGLGLGGIEVMCAVTCRNPKFWDNSME